MALKSNQRTIAEGDFVEFFTQVRLRAKFPGPSDQLVDDGASLWQRHAQRVLGQAGRVLVNPGMKGSTGNSMIDNAESEASSRAGSGCDLNVNTGIDSNALQYDSTADKFDLNGRADNTTDKHYASIKQILGEWVELDFGDGTLTNYNNWSGVVGNTVAGNIQRIRFAWIKLNKLMKVARFYDSAPRTS